MQLTLNLHCAPTPPNPSPSEMGVSPTRALLVLLLLLAATSAASAYTCRYNCSTVFNIYCKTKDLVCPYPNGDDLAMERANLLLAKSTKKSCTRAMKLFICHLWFPTCVKEGAIGTVQPVNARHASRAPPPLLGHAL